MIIILKGDRGNCFCNVEIINEIFNNIVMLLSSRFSILSV